MDFYLELFSFFPVQKEIKKKFRKAEMIGSSRFRLLELHIYSYKTCGNYLNFLECKSNEL